MHHLMKSFIGGCFVICQSVDRGATVPQQTAEFARVMIDESADWSLVSFSAGRLIDHGGLGGALDRRPQLPKSDMPLQ